MILAKSLGFDNEFIETPFLDHKNLEFLTIPDWRLG